MQICHLPQLDHAVFCDPHIQTTQDFKPPLPYEFMCAHVGVDANLHTYLIIMFPLWDHSLIMGWGSKPGSGCQALLDPTWGSTIFYHIKCFSYISLSYILVIVYHL